MEDDILEALEAELEREAALPFANIERNSRMLGQARSHALHDAATNLLDKALGAWEGDHQRALAYVRRSAGLPFDSHEESHPAALVAGSILFAAVTDVLEESAEDDHVWLDAAEAVLADPRRSGRGDLRHVLEAIDLDYEPTPSERQRLRAAIATVPKGPDLADLVDLSTADLVQRITDVLDVYVAYLEAVEQLEGG